MWIIYKWYINDKNDTGKVGDLIESMQVYINRPTAVCDQWWWFINQFFRLKFGWEIAYKVIKLATWKKKKKERKKEKKKEKSKNKNKNKTKTKTKSKNKLERFSGFAVCGFRGLWNMLFLWRVVLEMGWLLSVYGSFMTWRGLSRTMKVDLVQRHDRPVLLKEE